MPARALPPDTAPEVAAVARSILRDFDRFTLVAKERSPFMRRLYRACGMRWWNPRFLDDVSTTIGWRVYMPPAHRTHPVAGVEILRHEAVHLEQFRRHPVWFPISYLFVLPAGITMRSRWELEAFTESMRCEIERTGDVSERTLAHLERVFTGPAYLFMDIRRARVRRRLHRVRDELRAAQAT